MGLGRLGTVAFSASALTLILVTLFLLFPAHPAAAQGGPPPSVNFSFHGYVKLPNGSFVGGVNVTVEVINFSAIVQGPPPVVQVASNLSGPDGFFNVTALLGGQNYNLKIKKYNTTITTVSWMGPDLPPFPEFFFTNSQMGILNSTFILQRAGNLNISVINASGQHVNFSYSIIDKRLGFPLETSEFNDSKNVVSKVVAVPYARNFTVQFFPYQSPPLEFTITNLSSYNLSPECLNNDTCYYFADVQVNNSMTPVFVYGYVNTTDFGGMNQTSSNFTNLSVAAYLVFAGENIFAEATLPPNMGQFLIFNGPKDTVNATGTPGLTPEGGAFYNITLPGTTTGFEVMLLFTGTGRSAQNSNAQNRAYVAFQNVTARVGQGNIPLNVTLARSAGAPASLTFTNTQIPSMYTNVTTIALSTTDSNAPVGQAFFEARFTTNRNPTAPSGRQYRWFLQTSQQTSLSLFPFPNTTTDLRLQIFSSNFAPLKKDVSNALLNSNNTLNYSLFQMDIRDPEQGAGTGGLKSQVRMDFYTSSAACDVPTPASNCSLAGFGNAGEFNPMKAMLGGAVSMRMTQSSGVTVHYVNVDMMASGPPDAAMDTETNDNKTSGTGFGEIWKFGSSGPTVYDYVLVGIPYSDQPGDLDENQTVNISVPAFYDNDWAVIWNVTANSSNATALGANYSDYAAKAGEWTTLMGNNTCATTLTVLNATQVCFINRTTNMIWLRIPHFSGTAPAIAGSTVATPATTSSSSGSSSSSGGGGGGGGAPVSPPVQVTKIFGLLAAGQAESFTITEERIAVSEVRFTASAASGNARIAVQKLGARPAALPEPGKEIFQYVEITPTDLQAAQATITFRVNETWLQEQAIPPEGVALLRYTTQWDTLETAYLGTGSGVARFQAVTPGFSTFAISGETPAAAAPPAACGDGTCAGDETPESCPADCTAPPALECSSGDLRCAGDQAQRCEQGDWVTAEACSNGCAGGYCLPESPLQGPAPNYALWWVVGLAAVIVVLVLGYILLPEKKK
ncbi:MAG: PGF-pre-PGF domain-containing protein [Candidatus Aenigmarchaeota archaeon]|nr:PGF-pre-PGF domain-containing protein [Candidatus Aenigmarchaeota archaeon]